MQNGVSSIVPMIVLLGLLIFVHELGHFLVAKYYKVRVEVFSLGFGPKLFKFHKGDTTYAISAIPLGGYVKMFGDDPTAEVADADKQHSFTHKPVGQRIGVVLAGPLMNFFFAIVLFSLVASIGETTLAPRLGDIKTDSAAYTAGFRSGDLITTADGQRIQTWEELQKTIESNADQKVTFSVLREPNQSAATVTATPQLVTNKNVMSWQSKVGEVDGVSYSSRASVIGVSDHNSIAAKAGLQSGDVIVAIDGKKVDKWRELAPAFAGATGHNELKITVERNWLDEKPDDSKAPLALKPPIDITLKSPLLASALAKNESGEAVMSSLGIENAELYLAGFDKTSPAQKAGLQVGDKLVSINDKAVGSFDEVANIIRSNSRSDEGLSIGYQRNGVASQVTVVPNMRERMGNQFKEEKRFEIGIKPMIIDAAPTQTEYSAHTPLAALNRGLSQTTKWTSLTVLGFVRLFEAKVSPKNIGGFFSIGAMAKKSWQVGVAPFLNVMAIISLNLFVLNLLPVPVLDGGHLVFFSVEALRGAPLSLRKLEIAQQVGMILLFSLMVFAMFNDVSRWFNS